MILNKSFQLFFVAEVGRCDANMEVQNNNQPTLDKHNNLYKIPSQENQVGSSSSIDPKNSIGLFSFSFFFFAKRRALHVPKCIVSI